MKDHGNVWHVKLFSDPFVFVFVFCMIFATAFVVVLFSIMSKAPLDIAVVCEQIVEAEVAEAEVVLPPDAGQEINEEPVFSLPNIDPNGGVIALTFDDGPRPGSTERLLDILKANNVRATFFVIGPQAINYSHIVSRAYNDGHQIANHTMNHRDLTILSDDEVIYEISATSNIIAGITGQMPTALRPPYSNTDSRVQSLAGGLRVVKWNLDPSDWASRNTNLVYNNVASELRDGSIVVLHDIYDSTVDAIQAIIDIARAHNYSFVTIDEMIALGRI